MIDKESIDKFIRQYNSIWSYPGLHEQMGSKMTPEEVCDSRPKWNEIPAKEIRINYYESGWWQKPASSAEMIIPSREEWCMISVRFDRHMIVFV
jgi:hypothetical protein